MTALAALQARFLALVTTGRGDPRGLLASGELGIYAHAYGARLLEALRGDHPKLEAALGAAQFATLIEGYVAARPPSSFTLRDYGIDLPGWLATADAPPWAADLARLERARVEVFDAADQVALSRDEVAALPPEALAALPLRWLAASAVVPLAWTVDDTWSDLEDDVAPRPPTPTARVVLVWRRDLAVIHRTLEADEAALASAVAAGVTFAEACEVVARFTDEPAARAIELLLRWLEAEALAPTARSTPAQDDHG
ncbi:MAG: putative DNA-binding domain-containing protein [Kofleriaceae bacterium]|nr:putative DNA-binding domain-containing protein [Kofleriaceae bacterium]MBP9168705.1 putative DNA-binding domain-containing protein [Kofleriaceae bacterium]MBP9862961.1 putative DNA-binding domain-containing protein [Kofleriaceae bacterium]